MKTQLSTLQRNQTFLKILIFTLVTVIIWVGMTLFRTQRSTEISPELIRLSEPLNPNINLAVIERIEQKRSFTPEELADFPIYSLFVSRTGEEQMVVFNASDRAKRPAGAPPETPPLDSGATESEEASEVQPEGMEAPPEAEQPPQDEQPLPEQPTENEPEQTQPSEPLPPPAQPVGGTNQLDSPTGQF